MTRDKIRERIQIQRAVEGVTRDSELLLATLPLVKYDSEWRALTKVKHHRVSNTRDLIFYYPSDLLLSLQNLFTVKVKE